MASEVRTIPTPTLMIRNNQLLKDMISIVCRRVFLPVLLLFICMGAQADPQLIQHLPNLTIHGFVQDDVGYIWIATDNGLCRYNGQVYYYYQNEPDDPASIPGNRVLDIRIDADGTLWIATSGGICVYDFQQDNYRTLLRMEGLNRIVFNGDRVVCSGPAGMVLFDAEKQAILGQRFASRHRPTVLEADPNGYLWGGGRRKHGV